MGAEPGHLPDEREAPVNPLLLPFYVFGFAWGAVDDVVGWVFLRNRRP